MVTHLPGNASLLRNFNRKFHLLSCSVEKVRNLSSLTKQFYYLDLLLLIALPLKVAIVNKFGLA